MKNINHSSSKKILFVATVDSHILSFHIPYLKYFKELGYEVHVMTNGDKQIPFSDKKYKVNFNRNPININNLKSIKQIKKILDSEKYDIIHTHTPVSSALIRIAAKKTRKNNDTKVIYTAHGFHFYRGGSIKGWLLFYPIEKVLAKYTDILILINKEDYMLAKRKFRKCKNICYINGIGLDNSKFDYKLTQLQKNNIKKELGIKKDDFVIIYPAEINNNKNQIWLIETLSELIKNNKNIHLLLPGKGKLFDKTKQLINNLNLDKNIHLLGFRNDIPNLLKISDMAVSSSKREGLPLNILESIYEKKPLVVTNVRGNRDLVKDDINGYVVPLGDKNAFVEKVELIYKNKELKKKLENGNSLIIENYLLNNVLNEMKKIYEIGDVYEK